MTKLKTAILWGQDDLLSEAMEIFLTTGESWSVVRIPIEQGADFLIDQAKKIEPAVIILYTGSCVGNPSLPMQLIQNQPNLRVVTVSLEDNQVQVFSKYSIRVRNVSDLLSIIEDGHLSNYEAKGGEQYETKD